MRGMILAAGRGTRMGDLTRAVPKPLLKMNGHYLIDYSLYSLAKIGVLDVVVNICYQAEMIKKALGNGARYGVNIIYSEEEVALETGGGIMQALPLLGDEPFVVLSCDIVTDYPLQNLPRAPLSLAHIVLVDNPVYHPKGDFCLYGQRVYHGKGKTLTFGNIGVYQPALFGGYAPGHLRLGEVLKKEITQQKISGEHYQGLWYNIGSPEDLALAEKNLVQQPQV
jgi:MurNAc alpha-1-phosphate uridylyltransferase